MNIRIATSQDCTAVRNVYLAAFPEAENEIVAKLAIDLFSEMSTPKTISIVTEIDGAVVGHIAFSPVIIDNNENFLGYILAPLAVKPDYQKRRIGSELIDYGMQQLSIMGVNIIFVYGDPNYYGKFGFSVEAARQYTTPYNLQYPFGWQAIVLKNCEIGNTSVAITCVPSLRDAKLW